MILLAPSRSIALATFIVTASVFQIAYGYNGGPPYGASPYGNAYSYANKIPGSNMYPESSYNTYTSLGIFSPNTETSALYGPVNTVCPTAPERVSAMFTLICCNQRPILTTIPPESAKCCGETVYHTDEAVCCAGTATPFTPGLRFACCGEKAYDRNDEVCCGGKLYEAEFGVASACCGIPKYVNYTENAPTQYSITTQVCCNGRIQELTDIFQADFETITAEFGEDVSSKVGCCKDKAYSTLSQKCCYNTIHNVTDEKARCCRSDIMDDTQLCCNGFVFNNKTINKCCGVNAYNPKTSKCCGGYPSPSPGGEEDPMYSCCGILPYNTLYQTCCSGVIINSPSTPNQRCCGFKPYDKTTSVCCDEEFIVKKGVSCYDKY